MHPSDFPFVRTGPVCICGDRRVDHVGQDPLIPSMTTYDTLCHVPGCTGCPYGYQAVGPLDRGGEATVRQAIDEAAQERTALGRNVTTGVLVVVGGALLGSIFFDAQADLIIGVVTKVLVLLVLWTAVPVLRDRGRSLPFKAAAVVSVVTVGLIAWSIDLPDRGFLTAPLLLALIATIVGLAAWDAWKDRDLAKLPTQIQKVMTDERLLSQVLVLTCTLPLTVARHDERVSSE